jgi:hypothetical protein
VIRHVDTESTEERNHNSDANKNRNPLSVREPQHVLLNHAGSCHEVASIRRTRFGMMNQCRRDLACVSEAEKGSG